jgi:2,4-dienoyl-CoA reductase-like NADH-dependent reductase (Old Yellow Enzyme family)/thioredoxin reductase
VSLESIFRPITINRLVVKNRIARASHGTSYGRGTVSEDLVAYHEARAKSGVGLNILEATVVHRSTSNHTVDAVDDTVIPGFEALARSSDRFGMRTFVQLWHGGHRWAPASGQAPLSASNVPCPLGLVNTPFAMTLDQIEEITEAYADAAARVQQGGLHGVEVHFGHGYLIHQFLCPLTNRREDEYGGDLDGRMRFGRGVLQAVRDRVGADFPVGVRLSDYNVPGGLTPEEAGEVIARLCAEKRVDYVSGSMGSPYSIASMLGAMDQPAGYMLSSAEPIVARADVPTMIAGRYRTLEEGAQAIREGLADMVSFVRPMIADPDLVAKTARGEVERVRPCIACNQGCIGGIRTAQQRMACTVNPAVGYERTLSEDLITPVTTPRTVVVVGGGPAGMEAARLAALHGHKVVLMEAQPTLGGTINIARRAPKLAAIGDITFWQEQELRHLGVDIRLSTFAEADEVLAETPDVVIVATGSLPRMDGLQAARPEAPVPGFERPHVVSSHEVMLSPSERFGRSAVVFDDVGHYEAIAAAEQLIVHGLKVTFVARHSSFAPQIEVIVRTGPALRRLRQGDFTLVVGGRLVEIGERACTLGYLDGEQTWEVPADSVVFVSNNEAQTDLYRALGGGTRAVRPYELHLIGDANAPRDLLMAIREGHMAGRIGEAQHA